MKERFWEKVTIRGHDDCWLWAACVDNEGYGRFVLDRRIYRAHRISWEISNGPIPNGVFVCHKCDVPGCVNPAHLFIGTGKDNLRDMSKKGRAALQKNPERTQGENHPRHKLTAAQVYEIRAAYDALEAPHEIARRYPFVNQNTIWYAANRQSWKSLPEVK